MSGASSSSRSLFSRKQVCPLKSQKFAPSENFPLGVTVFDGGVYPAQSFRLCGYYSGAATIRVQCARPARAGTALAVPVFERKKMASLGF